MDTVEIVYYTCLNNDCPKHRNVFREGDPQHENCARERLQLEGQREPMPLWLRIAIPVAVAAAIAGGAHDPHRALQTPDVARRGRDEDLERCARASRRSRGQQRAAADRPALGATRSGFGAAAHGLGFAIFAKHATGVSLQVETAKHAVAPCRCCGAGDDFALAAINART